MYKGYKYLILPEQTKKLLGLFRSQRKQAFIEVVVYKKFIF